MSALGRVARRHRLGLLVAFLLAAATAGGVFEWRWRQAALRSTPAAAAAAAPAIESQAAELLQTIGAVFDVEIEAARAQRAERDDALAMLDAEVASGAPDAAAREARLATARRRAAAIAESLTRDRAALAILQALPSPEMAFGAFRTYGDNATASRDLETAFGLRWQVTPFVWSWGLHRKVNRFRWFVVDPIARNSGRHHGIEAAMRIREIV